MLVRTPDTNWTPMQDIDEWKWIYVGRLMEGCTMGASEVRVG